MSEVQSHYNSLLASGELLDLFPDLKGDWMKDKKIFTKNYEENQKVINDVSLEIDDDEDDESCDSETFLSF